MDTETPSLVDVSVHYVWEWMLQFRALRHTKDLFDTATIPATTAVRFVQILSASRHVLTATCTAQWISRMTEYVVAAHTECKPVLGNISGARAAEIITASTAESPRTVGFDQTEASRLGIKLNEMVSVTPDDNGSCPFFHHRWNSSQIGQQARFLPLGD